MKSILAISLCFLEIASAHFLDLKSDEFSDEFIVIWQAEFIMVALLGLLSDGGQRDRSILTVFVIWFGWIFITDWAVIEASALLVEYEAVIFSALVFWAMVRLYYFTSDPLSKDTVCIVFYRGNRAPFLSSLAALIGLPFSSVAVAMGEFVLMASKKGHMVIADSKVLNSRDFVCIDTGVKAQPEITEAAFNCAGAPTKSMGFRTKCVSNLLPVLKQIGYAPRTIFHKIPSIFYSQCVKLAHLRESV